MFLLIELLTDLSGTDLPNIFICVVISNNRSHHATSKPTASSVLHHRFPGVLATEKAWKFPNNFILSFNIFLCLSKISDVLWNWNCLTLSCFCKYVLLFSTVFVLFSSAHSLGFYTNLQVRIFFNSLLSDTQAVNNLGFPCNSRTCTK